MKIRYLALSLLFFLHSYVGEAQSDSQPTPDTSNSELITTDSEVASDTSSDSQPEKPSLENLLNSMAIADSVRSADSIRRVRIKELIANELGNDVKERESLLNELQELRSRDSISRLSERLRLDSIKAAGYGQSVLLQEDSIITIYSPVGSFSISERAEAISERIKEIAKAYDYQADSILVSNIGSDTYLRYKDQNIIYVSKEDSYWEGQPIDTLASSYMAAIRKGIKKYNDSYSIMSFVLEVLLALLVITLLIVSVKLINKGTTILTAKLLSLEGTFFTGFKFRGYELLNGHRQVGLLIGALRFIRLAVLVFIFYITIPIILSIFPWTRGWAESLFGYVLNPLKKIGGSVIAYIPNLITIIIVFVLVKSVTKFLKFITLEIENENLNLPGFYPDWAKPTFNIVRILLYAYAFVVIFNYLPGSESKVFQGVTVFLGVLFSLGSSSAIANMIAGVVITYMRPFRIGDRVKIGEVTGDVLQKTLLVTRIRTTKNEEITIPNSNILSNHTTNYTYFTKKSESPGLILHTTVTIGYDVSWRDVHRLLIEAARKTDNVSDKTEPFVLQTSLDDFYVSYQLNCYTYEAGMIPKIYSQLHSNIQDAFAANDIEIMSPHYRAERDGSAITIPQGYRKEENSGSDNKQI